MLQVFRILYFVSLAYPVSGLCIVFFCRWRINKFLDSHDYLSSAMNKQASRSLNIQLISPLITLVIPGTMIMGVALVFGYKSESLCWWGLNCISLISIVNPVMSMALLPCYRDSIVKIFSGKTRVYRIRRPTFDRICPFSSITRIPNAAVAPQRGYQS